MVGRKSLITNRRDEIMSLQKIQVELDSIRLMGNTESEEAQALNQHVWTSFKNWKNEPKPEKKFIPKNDTPELEEDDLEEDEEGSDQKDYKSQASLKSQKS